MYISAVINLHTGGGAAGLAAVVLELLPQARGGVPN